MQRLTPVETGYIFCCFYPSHGTCGRAHKEEMPVTNGYSGGTFSNNSSF